MIPRDARESFTTRGDLLREDVPQTWGNRMVPFLVDRYLGVSRSMDRLASGRVGTGVQPLQGEQLYV